MLVPAILVWGLASGAAAQSVEGEVSAQPTDAPYSSAVGELVQVRARYGFALRSGAQEDIGPGLSYTGFTPLDGALSAWFFTRGYFGGAVHVQAENFALHQRVGAQNQRVTGGTLLRGHVGPSGRYVVGPARFELLAGYAFAQLPTFGISVDPRLQPAQRHAVLLASRVLIDFGALNGEVRGEYPIPLSVRGPQGVSAKSTGFAAGAALLLPIATVKRLRYGGVADFQFVRDDLELEDGTRAGQSLARLGLGLDVKWFDAPPPPPPPKYGDLWVTVFDVDTGQPLEGASVVVQQDGRTRPLDAVEAARFGAKALDPGPVVARATVGGYVPADASGSIVAGQSLALEVRLKKEPPKVGGLKIVITDKESAQALAGATVIVNDAEYIANEKGEVVLADLKPGPLQVKATLKGYRPAQEVAQVVALRESAVPLQMLKAQKKLLATITGIVRSTQGGAPVQAELEIPQARIKTRANAQGAFTFRVEGGTYSVNISAPGYIKQSKNVTVRDGDQAIFNVDLHPK